MEEEMIKDVAHTFGRGSLDMRRIILHEGGAREPRKRVLGKQEGEQL